MVFQRNHRLKPLARSFLHFLLTFVVRSDEFYYFTARNDRYILAVLIALVLMVILVYVVAIYYMQVSVLCQLAGRDDKTDHAS